MHYLPAAQTPDARVALAVSDTPLPWLVKLPATSAGSRMNRELAALAISRIARNDPRMAAEQLSKIESRLQAGEKGWAWSQIGWQAAQRHLGEALEWYRKAGEAALSDEVAQWKVRAALRAQDWGAVRSTMPAGASRTPITCLQKLPGSRTSIAIWPMRNWAGQSSRHPERFRQPVKRWPRLKPIRE
jgi:soluble lytic murein transglycosylase